MVIYQTYYIGGCEIRRVSDEAVHIVYKRPRETRLGIISIKQFKKEFPNHARAVERYDSHYFGFKYTPLLLHLTPPGYEICITGGERTL